MNKLTKALLLECQKIGYTYIGIGARSVELPQSLSFPDDYERFSIFAHPDIRFSKHSNAPAIWHIVDMFPCLENSCGNSQQSQIRRIDLLDKGVYNLTELDLGELSSKQIFMMSWYKHRPPAKRIHYF